MIFTYSPLAANHTVSAAALPSWRFSEGVELAPAPLSAQQLAWIREGGADTADRFTFHWQDVGQPAGESNPQISGALLLLTSQTWRGQHRPERCFEVFGLTVNESVTVLQTPDFPFRYLTLSGSITPEQVSAVYWLQSDSQTTDDFGQRIWADLSPQRERWVLVTVLFDRIDDPHSPVLSSFLTALHESVSLSLKEASYP